MKKVDEYYTKKTVMRIFSTDSEVLAFTGQSLINKYRSLLERFNSLDVRIRFKK